MAGSTTTKRTLSKNLSQMKFMRRLNPSLDQDEAEESGALIEKWVARNIPKPLDESQEPAVVRCSFAECEDLDPCGRFSYNKFNKEVERLAKQTTKPDISEEDEGTIPAVEVARRYEEITSRKFLGKRQRSEVGIGNVDRDGFIKPS